MDELKRISRYILPGITVSFVLISFLLLTTEIYEDYINSVFKNSEFFVSILAIIFSSGALGFIFSLIYYPITQVIFPFFAVDHRIIFKECLDKIEIIKKINPKEVIDPEYMTRRDAWILANQLWIKIQIIVLLKIIMIWEEDLRTYFKE
ncbi:MAG: hypothetical protein A2033_09120 [Bacteroidetes bacterium GWA2_31_9]|nr:MAG: hypothetical protein A2033_09120 [Bacteroidetes bacterium GWA2_31_9]